MHIQLNGEMHQLQVGLSIAQLIEQLSLESQHLVVEHNGSILAPEQWQQTPVQEGDHVELITFMGGGSAL